MLDGTEFNGKFELDTEEERVFDEMLSEEGRPKFGIERQQKQSRANTKFASSSITTTEFRLAERWKE